MGVEAHSCPIRLPIRRLKCSPLSNLALLADAPQRLDGLLSHRLVITAVDTSVRVRPGRDEVSTGAGLERAESMLFTDKSSGGHVRRCLSQDAGEFAGCLIRRAKI